MLNLLPLAARSLIRNRRRTFLTLLAILVGVAVVVFATGFGNGFLDMMALQSINARIGAIQVHRAGYLDATEAAPLKLDLPDHGELLEKVRGTPGVKAVARRIRFGGMMSNGLKSSMIMGQGLDPLEEFRVCPDRASEIAGGGSHVRADKAHGAVVGGELAKSYQSSAGDTLTVTASGREGGINALDVEIVGITRGAAPMESKRALTLPLAYAQELLQMEGRVTEYAVAVDDIKNAPAIAQRLRERLGPEYEVSTWDQIVPFLRDMVNRLTIILSIISVVLFVIVIFGVVNTMLMSVYERVREIGTMLAVGIRRRQVLSLFLLEAVTLGGLGGALGAALGFALTAYFHAAGILISPPGAQFKQMIRPEADPKVALLAVAVATLGAMLAAAYPARKASLMNPVEALRTL